MVNAIGRSRDIFQTSIQLDQRELFCFPSPPLAVPGSQPSAGLLMEPRAVPRKTDGMQRQRAGSSDDARFGYDREPTDFQSSKRESRWEQPPSHSVCQEEHQLRFDDRSSGGQVDRDDVPSSEFSGPGYRSRRNGHLESEPASRDVFGSMAPCWRLLERAKGYMDKVCVVLLSSKMARLACQMKAWTNLVQGDCLWRIYNAPTSRISIVESDWFSEVGGRFSPLLLPLR